MTQQNSVLYLRVGIFSLLGLLLIGAVTVYVNDRPYWWRSCQPVKISVEDATGLKTKSPVRSLGLEIGYLRAVELTETFVRLSICITAPVQVLPSTRAYIRGEGFLGDKFVELKPVRYTGKIIRGEPIEKNNEQSVPIPADETKPESQSSKSQQTSSLRWVPRLSPVLSWARWGVAAVSSSAQAESPRDNEKEVPVGKQSQDLQKVVDQVDNLISEMTALTSNLKQAVDPKELRSTIQQLNKTLENASRTLSPEGGLNTTAQRTLAKLEEAIESLRDIMARVNKGEGSIGMLVNDPSYADEIREAIRNVNRLLGRVGEIRFAVTVGGELISGYDSGRAYFLLQIWPRRDRYYLLGATVDPRGKRTVKTYTTEAGGVSSVSKVTEVEDGGILLDLMLGKIFVDRIELALGLLHGDGTATGALRLGPNGREEFFTARADLYSRGKGYGLDARFTGILNPFPNSAILSSVFLRGGLESTKKVAGKNSWFVGAGVTFDDQDIKLLFALR